MYECQSTLQLKVNKKHTSEFFKEVYDIIEKILDKDWNKFEDKDDKKVEHRKNQVDQTAVSHEATNV